MVADGGVPFGPWLLGELLGLGGFAEVRRAVPRPGHDVPVVGPVALKRLLPMLAGEDVALRAFQAERTALSRVRGPQVVHLFASGMCRGLPWLALEVIDGVSLLQVLRAGPLSVATASAVLVDVARGLACCHAAGVLHGDLAPSNVLVDRRGRAHLIDFGLATWPGGPQRARGAGTPAYLDPHAAIGAERRPASDLFALGLLWIRMRTGARPWGPGGADEQRRRAAARQLDPTLCRAAMADLPDHAASLLWRAIGSPPGLMPPDNSVAAPVSAAALVDGLLGEATASAAIRQLSCRVQGTPRRRSASFTAAEDRGERLTDPSGETVTHLGKSAADVDRAGDLD